MRLAILGPPGSGKTTQADILSRVFGLRHIYMGDLLRRESESESPIAETIRRHLALGELVPEDIVIAVLAREIADAEDDYILDGAPRTLAQALGLQMILSEQGESLDAVISLEVSNDELVRRLTARGRTDDRPGLILRRVEIFHRETDPVIRLYEEQGLLIRVSGEGSPASVADRILHQLHQRFSTKTA